MTWQSAPAESRDAPLKDAGAKAHRVRYARAHKSARIERPEYLCFMPGSGGTFAWDGLIGWLATEGGRREHRNIADAGLVRVTASGQWSWGRFENVVEGIPKVSCSASEVVPAPFMSACIYACIYWCHDNRLSASKLAQSD